MKHFCLFLSSLALTALAFAAKPEQVKFEPYEWTKLEAMPGLIKEARARHKSRVIASNSPLSDMSSEYKKLSDKILKTKTADEVEELLTLVESEYEKYPEDAQFLAASLLLLKPLRGLTYRMIPMVSEQNITHSYLRTVVGRLASNLRVYLPLEHWEAGFAYVTEPYEVSPGKAVSQFISSTQKNATSAFQDYLANQVYPAMMLATKRINQLSLNKPIVWDNRLVFGKATFNGDEETRFRYLFQGEKHLALSTLHSGMHYLNYLTAYNVEDIFRLSRDIGKLYGFDGYMFKKVEGVSSYRIGQVVKKYPQVLTLRPNGDQYMQHSFRHLREAIYQVRLAREELRNQSSGNLWLLNPDRLNPWGEAFEKQIALSECLVKSLEAVCPVRSAITGEVVKVSLGNFYANPPRDLKSFIPTAWDTKEKVKRNKALNVSWPNHSWGKPTQWNVAAYKGVFPEISKSESVPESVRVLRQAYGGEPFGAPFALFVE